MRSLYGNYRTRTFAEIFPSLEHFTSTYENNPLPLTKYFGAEDSEQVSMFYYLMYARYGNSHIASSDENRFIFNLLSTLMQYGPNWYKKLELQRTIRELSIEQVKAGSRNINNFAENPSIMPSTDTLQPLDYINNQSVSTHLRSDIDALTTQYDMLSEGETKLFLDKFKGMFLYIVEPELPLWYDSVEGWEE